MLNDWNRHALSLVLYTHSLMHRPTTTIPVVSEYMGNEGRTLIGPWGYYLNRNFPFAELPLRTSGPVPAGSR